MRLTKHIMIALVNEQANSYNANSRGLGQIIYDNDNETLVIITNEQREFEFETGQDMDARDAKEAGIYDTFITVHHAVEAHE